MQSSIPVNARSLQRRYSLTLLLSAVLLFMSIAAYGWVAIRAEKKALFAKILSQSAELQLSLNDTIDVAQSHVSTMRHSVETRLANPELADSEFFARMSLAASGAPKDAPWDNLPPHLKAQAGSVNIDPAAQNEPKVFKRDFAAANSILAQAAGIHAHHKVFQWSYYYDATQQWWLVYPPQSRQELLTATNTTNMTSALKVLFDADGTLPVLAAGPKKNPQREMIWTIAPAQ